LARLSNMRANGAYAYIAIGNAKVYSSMVLFGTRNGFTIVICMRNLKVRSTTFYFGCVVNLEFIGVFDFLTWSTLLLRISLARYRCGHFWVPRRPLDGTAKKSLIWYRYHESGQSWPIRRTSAVIA
jgi:hypothetical protein